MVSVKVLSGEIELLRTIHTVEDEKVVAFERNVTTVPIEQEGVYEENLRVVIFIHARVH